MNVRGYKKFNNCSYNFNKKNNFNNCCKNKFNLNSLYEIENFLCNFKNICKGIKLYKILK